MNIDTDPEMVRGIASLKIRAIQDHPAIAEFRASFMLMLQEENIIQPTFRYRPAGLSQRFPRQLASSRQIAVRYLQVGFSAKSFEGYLVYSAVAVSTTEPA